MTMNVINIQNLVVGHEVLVEAPILGHYFLATTSTPHKDLITFAARVTSIEINNGSGFFGQTYKIGLKRVDSGDNHIGIKEDFFSIVRAPAFLLQARTEWRDHAYHSRKEQSLPPANYRS